LTKIKTSWSFTKSEVLEEPGPAFVLNNLDTIQKIDGLTSRVILRFLMLGMSNETNLR
jgi:hypothetical protein